MGISTRKARRIRRALAYIYVPHRLKTEFARRAARELDLPTYLIWAKIRERHAERLGPPPKGGSGVSRPSK